MASKEKNEREAGSAGKKNRYEKPSIKSESLTAVAALCNGTTSAGRKATVAGPPPCQSSKLKS